MATSITRTSTTPEPPTGPERLPLRWGLIIIGALLGGAVGYTLAGPFLAMGTVLAVSTALHTFLD